MTDKLSLRSKFIIPMVILIAILLFFGATLFYVHYERQERLKTLLTHIEDAHEIADLVHELQKERDLSAGYLLNNNDHTFKAKLSQQRRQTDRAIRAFLRSSRNDRALTPSKRSERYRNIDRYIRKIRHGVDEGEMTYNDAVLAYSARIAALLQRISVTIDTSTTPKLTRELLAYTHLLYMKEYRGIERAKGVYLFTQRSYTLTHILDYHNYIVRDKEHERMVLTYIDDSMRPTFVATLRNNDIERRIERIRHHIVQRKLETLPHTDAHEWYALMTRSVDALHHLSKTLETHILRHIRHMIRSHESRFIIVTAVSILSLFIFMLMMIAFFRLYNEEQKLRNVFEKYIISSVTDLKGRIVSVSEAFCNISGYTKEELVGQPHNIVRHPDMPKELFKTLWKRLKNGESWSGKIKNRKKDGGFYWVYAHIEPLYDRKGDIEAYIAIRIDITENELLHERIVQKEKESKAAYEMMLHQSRLAQMGELLSMIAHQWRQPLNTLSVTAGTLKIKAQRDRVAQEEIVRVTDRIDHLIRHLNQTIDDFRNFFKPDKAKTVVTFTEIVRSVQNIIAKTLETKGITCHITIQDDREFVCYKNEMIQVLLNIIKNAEDALSENQVVSPYIALSVNDFVIEIVDNAGGIPDDVMPKIYDPYFSTKMQKDGTGLGLYMSKLIVEDHCGGKLTAFNTEHGACFRIDLRHLRRTDTCELPPYRRDEGET